MGSSHSLRIDKVDRCLVQPEPGRRDASVVSDLSLGFSSIFGRSGYDFRAELQFLPAHLHQIISWCLGFWFACELQFDDSP